VHETTYEALREISPLLGSRTGLSTAENPMAHVAAKLAELVAASRVRASPLDHRRVRFRVDTGDSPDVSSAGGGA